MKRLLNWFRLRNLESALERELKYRIEWRVSDLILSGLPEPEARRQATLELGGVTQVQEKVRDIWLTRWLQDFAYDLRFSVRSFLEEFLWLCAAHSFSPRYGECVRGNGLESISRGQFKRTGEI